MKIDPDAAAPRRRRRFWRRRAAAVANVIKCTGRVFDEKTQVQRWLQIVPILNINK